MTAEELYRSNVADLRCAMLVYALRLKLVCGEDYERTIMAIDRAKTPAEELRANLQGYRLILSRVVNELEKAEGMA